MALEIKLVLAAVVLALLGAGVWYIRHDGYKKGLAEGLAERDKVQAIYDAHLAEDKRLKEIAENEKLRIEAEQAAKAKAASTAYKNVSGTLDTALTALRLQGDAPVLCGGEQSSVRVADYNHATLPQTTTYPPGIINPAPIAASARPTFAYEDALADTLQCAALIKLVTPH